MENENKRTSNEDNKKEKVKVTFLASRIFKWVTNSAIFGLVLTLAIFLFEQYKNSSQQKEIVDNLMYVQKSLSTKYLGLFPDYLDQINEILEGAAPNDTVVIFEDVLYYGFTSKPEDFKKMHKRLISLADSKQNKVFLAYYNPERNTFKRMILDQFIATDLSEEMYSEIHEILSSKGKRRDRGVSDSIAAAYFDKTRAADMQKFRTTVDKKRRPLAKLTGNETGLDLELETLYSRIDSVRAAWVSGDYEQLTLKDFENMYREVDLLLADEYCRHGVELIPIDENLSIGCWLVADKAIIAFPSKYATDEIGFYSQDPAFSKYIMTMLNGLRSNYKSASDSAFHKRRQRTEA